ncbi:hypothetical protein ES703_94505 [subsurface metagenome]
MKTLKKKCDKKEAEQFDHTEENESGKVQAALFEGAQKQRAETPYFCVKGGSVENMINNTLKRKEQK